MNEPISCGAQDMLEAAIIQRRRLVIISHAESGEQELFDRALPIDIGSHKGKECLTILTTDNDGGILKININTGDITYFEAKDYQDPRIHFKK